jgi:hypothetical protein
VAYSFAFIKSSSQAAVPWLCNSFNERRVFSALLASSASAAFFLAGDGATCRDFLMVDLEKVGPLLGCLLMVPIKLGVAHDCAD